MRRNLRQSIVKSLGRYIAIVMIIALGAALFVGLLMTKADMVATGQKFMDQQNMFDLRLMNSYGWNWEHLDEVFLMDGVVDAEPVLYMDLISRTDDAQEDAVYRYLAIPERINQVALRGGRMPEAPDEVLADDLSLSPDELGTEITVIHQEDSVFAYDTYTVVGLCNSPQYMNMNRGTSTLGDGTVRGFLFLQEAGFDTDYWTEIFIRLEGEHDAFSDHYLDDLSLWEDPMLELLEEGDTLVVCKLDRFARTAIEDGSFVGCFCAIDFGYALTDEGVDFFCLLCGSGLTCADSPDWFVGDYDILPLFCREMEYAAFEFCFANCFLLICFALFKAFADAENNLQAVCEGEVYFLLQDFGSLVVVLATFAMAEDNVLCTCALYHFCANFACVCAAFFVGTVFCTNSDDAVLQEFANGGEVDEGCADYYFAIGLFCSQHVFEFCGECYAFLQVLVHFPVTCYDFLSHVFCFLLINVFIF